MSFFSFLYFILVASSVSVNAYANSEVQVVDGYTLTSYQQPQDRMSCRHMNLRNKSLTKFTDWLIDLKGRVTSYDSLKGFRDYLDENNRFSISDLRKERTYRVNYLISDPDLIQRVDESEHIVFSSGFDLDSRDPNGGFSFSDLKVEKTGDSRLLSFDISGLESCFSKKAEVAFYSHCPLEKISFDTCEYRNGECTGTPSWESRSFVVDWWNCSKQSVIEFDFSSIFRTHGVSR